MKNKLIVLISLLAIVVLLAGCYTTSEPGYIAIVDSNGNILTTNNETNTFVTMRYHESAVHDGDSYYVKDYKDIDGEGTNLDFLWVIGSTYRPHAQWYLSAESEYIMCLYEDVTVSDNGTAVNVFNANRNSSNNTIVRCFTSPTLASGTLGDGSDGGNMVWCAVIGSGKDATVGIERNYDFIAKPDSNYWFRITKMVAGTHWLDYDFNWYEH